MKHVAVGLYGMNGHQVHGLLPKQPLARLVATAACDVSKLPPELRRHDGIKHYATLDEMLADPRIALVSLCSPRRRDQAADAVKCLRAGKHVYAEKPSAMLEQDLDLIIRTARESARCFREMAGTAFDQPYLAMRQLVQTGVLGTIVQVFAQKSYPYYDGRAQDEEIDGGIIGQNAIHAVRFVEHVAGVRIREIGAVETLCGNPQAAAGGSLRMAATLMFKLDNGGCGCIIANYLNPHQAFGSWGNEHLRIFGTKGFVESVDGGKRTRVVLADRDAGPLDTAAPSLDYFELYLKALLGLGDMPLTSEAELHCTRVVLRAKISGLLPTAPQLPVP